jgi:hypothetical protein
MFRFTIRELALLTIIVAMGVGWWVDHRQQGDYRTISRWQNRVLVEELEFRSKGKVEVDADQIKIHLPDDLTITHYREWDSPNHRP